MNGQFVKYLYTDFARFEVVNEPDPEIEELLKDAR
jgi:hypothetical protein